MLGAWTFLCGLSFINSLQTKEGVDGLFVGPWERNARLMTEEAKPFTKIALFLARPHSENLSASTGGCFNSQRYRKLLISFVAPSSPGQLNEDACGLPPSQHGATAAERMKTHPAAHLKDVEAPSQNILLDRNFFSDSKFNQLGSFLVPTYSNF